MPFPARHVWHCSVWLITIFTARQGQPYQTTQNKALQTVHRQFSVAVIEPTSETDSGNEELYHMTPAGGSVSCGAAQRSSGRYIYPQTSRCGHQLRRELRPKKLWLRIYEQINSKVSDGWILYLKQTKMLTHAIHVNGWEPTVSMSAWVKISVCFTFQIYPSKISNFYVHVSWGLWQRQHRMFLWGNE